MIHVSRKFIIAEEGKKEEEYAKLKVKYEEQCEELQRLK